MFSVVIPLYNKGVLVKRAIDSVLSQKYDGALEVVVVDDGSTDNSLSFVEAYNDTRVRVIKKQNGGVSSARNIGIKEAQYNWIILLDADDEFLPDTLQIYANLIICFPESKFMVTQQNSHYTSRGILQKLFKTFLGAKNTIVHPYLAIWMRLFYPTPGIVCFSKELPNLKGFFDTRMSFFEDINFMCRMINGETIAFASVPTMNYYQEQIGLSGSSHPIEKEMAFYIPEQIATASFWHKALLYENIEMEILWWKQHGNEANVRFYQDMQKRYFSRIFKALHWVRQKMIRKGII